MWHFIRKRGSDWNEKEEIIDRKINRKAVVWFRLDQDGRIWLKDKERTRVII